MRNSKRKQLKENARVIKMYQDQVSGFREELKRLNEQIEELESGDALADLLKEKSYWKIKYAKLKDREDQFSVDALRLQRQVDKQALEIRQFNQFKEILREII